MAKETTYEDALKASEKATAARKAARKEVEDFATANGLNAKKDHSEDEKHGKAYKKLRKAWKEAKAAEEEALAAAKALKPASERNTTYTYPADVTTAEEKKKFRAKARAAAKAAEKAEAKGEKSDKPAKKDKKAKEVEAPAAEPAKSDKKKKKKAASTEED